MRIVYELTCNRFYDLVKPVTGWPDKAIYELYDYLNAQSDDLGELIDIDPAALRDEWSYYPSDQECRDAYKLPDGKDLEDFTVVLRFDGGVLVQNF